MTTDEAAVPWVLDVTLRDGGYVNQHSWTLSEAVRITTAAATAGVPVPVPVRAGVHPHRRHHHGR